MRKSAGKAKRTGMLILCLLAAVLSVLLFLRRETVPAVQSLQPEENSLRPSLPAEEEAFGPSNDQHSPSLKTCRQHLRRSH